MLGGHKMRLTNQNPHVPLNKLQKMTKLDLIAAIRGYAAMSYHKDTLIDILNHELCNDPDAEVKP